MDRLASRLGRGEKTAFAELYDMCGDRLYNYVLRKLGSPEDAADVVQETFLRLARARRKLARVADPVSYAFTVARNEAARHAGRKFRDRRSIEPWSERLPARKHGEEQRRREMGELLVRGLALLDGPLREVVELKLFGELTFSQIASALGLPQGTIATRYRTALERLRHILAKEVK